MSTVLASDPASAAAAMAAPTTAAAVGASSAAAGPGLSRPIMIGWGLGTLGPVIIVSATNAMLLRFMTDYVGIAAGVAAMLIGLSKVYDAVTDPIMGAISDNSKSSRGRRRPYLLWGGVLMAISLVGLFWVPPLEGTTARSVYMGAALIFYAAAYSCFSIPYMAMPAEMTSNYHERTELMSYRVLAVGVAQLLAMFLGVALVDWLGGGTAGHLGMALALSPVVLLSACVVYVATRRAPFTMQSTVRQPFAEQARSVLSNRPYLLLIGIKLLTLTALSAQAVFPYFFQRILGVSNVYLGSYFAAASVTLIISQPLWIWISRRLGKRNTYCLALLLSMPVGLSWFFAQAGDPLWWVFARGVLQGLAGGGALLMGQSLLPDTMEYDYLRTGLRREGVFAGFYATVEKLAGAIGISVVGAILSAAGYIQSRGADVVQPESALTAIRMIVAFLPASVSLAALLLLMGYTLSEERLRALRAEPR